jgi:hypothetical protein
MLSRKKQKDFFSVRALFRETSLAAQEGEHQRKLWGGA